MNDFLSADILFKTLDDLPIGIGVFQVEDLNDNKSIRYVFMNKVVLYEMRKTKEEVFGKKIHEVAPEAYEHEGGLFVIETYRKIAKEGGSINLGLVEYSNHMVAGTYECSVHHIADNYVYVMLRNVTELEQTKNQLQLKNKELNQFAYIVSHDLKAPLRTITSFIDLLKGQHQNQLDEETKAMFGFISEAALRMDKLITDILDFSRIGETKEMAMVDLRKLVEIIQQDLAERINDTKASIKVGDLPKIKGYETELRMLLQNLIGNALKFNKPGRNPEIEIYAKEENGWTIFIKDNGIGIAEKHQEKIFGVFQRLHDQDNYEGTGIGLAHCKKIVELHNGELGVESIPDEGSTFYFSIPSQDR
jgi:light-regulated signal transduction histidine kinase (bacteriophytochrome)